MGSSDRFYEIYEVAELTGLAPARLRAWERRYAVVRPERQANRYRAYSARQVALLRAYARLIQTGSRIGDLVKQPVEQVIARAEAGDQDRSPVGAFLGAMERLDRAAMHEILQNELRQRGVSAFCDQVILPLARIIGDRWALGTLPIALEHFASEVVVSTLKQVLHSDPAGAGPTVLAAALAGERHEWGVLSCLARAQAGGWRASYLGADLPISQCIDVAWRIRPAMLALSASDPDNVQRQLPELQTLVRRLPEWTRVVAGGRGFMPHEVALRAAGILLEPGEFPSAASFTSPGGPT